MPVGVTAAADNQYNIFVIIFWKKREILLEIQALNL